ncbi:MAG: hypothetical protein ACT4TC_06505 [Myxococcaceae bacterium]
MTPDQDPLDSLLSKAEPYVDDVGFTENVMARLPVASERRRLRVPIILGFTVLACALGLWLVPDVSHVLALSRQGANAAKSDLLPWATLLGGLLIAGLSARAGSSRLQR